MFYLFRTCSSAPAGGGGGGGGAAKSLVPQGGRSACLSSEYTQLCTGPGQNSMFVKRFHWRCLSTCFFSLRGLWHPLRERKITFFPPFPSMHITRLSDTGSGAAHGNVNPIPSSPLGWLHTSIAVKGSNSSTAMLEGTPLPTACPSLLHGTKKPLLPMVNLCSCIPSCKERLPQSHLTDGRLTLRRWQRSLWQKWNLKLDFPNPKFIFVAASSFHCTS